VVRPQSPEPGRPVGAPQRCHPYARTDPAPARGLKRTGANHQPFRRRLRSLLGDDAAVGAIARSVDCRARWPGRAGAMGALLLDAYTSYDAVATRLRSLQEPDSNQAVTSWESAGLAELRFEGAEREELLDHRDAEPAEATPGRPASTMPFTGPTTPPPRSAADVDGTSAAPRPAWVASGRWRLAPRHDGHWPCCPGGRGEPGCAQSLHLPIKAHLNPRRERNRAAAPQHTDGRAAAVTHQPFRPKEPPNDL
jgi:hypothetical protein